MHETAAGICLKNIDDTALLRDNELALQLCYLYNMKASY